MRLRRRAADSVPDSPVWDPHDSDVTISVCPDGPLLVRGPVELRDIDGAPIARKRSTIALCRCGRTGIAPFCDSSHKKKPRGPAGARG
ncbi:CDGSH iron-sulfur domain-containing protein [Rhodococcus maanshanensis]|uniref:CDGSH iron-sulfur domain-containing protein n=1 Tax=Rhodococcus maanshanensis TaxID=183556 RepID=UPI0022B3F8AB|nr:CDGSH iron-sulfur domain-containing protein [Rhodococcus maanshanensis]MCZ4558829.1 CDGSH iron-sulfur domain-containing protein [Rhodococcus maanshanensis]